jgi:hypothetical protein
VLGIGAISYVIGSSLPATGMHYLDIAMRGSLITILYGVLIVVLNISPEVSILVQKTLQGMKGK